MLSAEDETRAFPDLAPDVVEHTVQTSHERFAGRPIRDFVPVLVERMAKTSLAQSALS